MPPQKKSCSLQFPLIMPRKFARTEKSDFSVTQNVFCEGVTLCNSNDTFPMECLVIRTGWRRCIECLKLQVIFHRWVTNDRALLQKMTYKDEASYGSSPPCSGWLDTFPSHISTLLRNSVAIVIHTSHSGWLDNPSPKCRWSYTTWLLLDDSTLLHRTSRHFCDAVSSHSHPHFWCVILIHTSRSGWLDTPSQKCLVIQYKCSPKNAVTPNVRRIRR